MPVILKVERWKSHFKAGSLAYGLKQKKIVGINDMLSSFQIGDGGSWSFKQKLPVIGHRLSKSTLSFSTGFKHGLFLDKY